MIARRDRNVSRVAARAACALLLAAACASAAAAPEPRSRVGRAYDPQTRELLYSERHTETLVDGRVVTDHVRYVDTQGRVFGEKRLDFSGNPYVPSFDLEDRRHGHLESVRRVSPTEIEVRYRERYADTVSEARLTLPPDSVVDAGFDRFIERNWEELTAGETRTYPFLVPSRLEFLGFRIRRSDDGADPAEVRFAIEIDSLLLRLLVPAMEVVYDRGTRRLLRYDGVSNLLDGNGENERVVIEFEYDDRYTGFAD